MNTNENDFNMKMKHGLRDDANGEIRQGLCEFIEEILISHDFKRRNWNLQSTILIILGGKPWLSNCGQHLKTLVRTCKEDYERWKQRLGKHRD